MKRAECIGMLYPELDDKVVVTIMGACAQELYDLGHRENFFYLQHAMGLASSIGLGLALHLLPHEKIVVLDGDGSVLMNLGTLATLARYRPRNLVHFIFDNGSLLSTGGFDSHTTSGITDLAAIARGAGIEHVAAVDSVMDFGEAAIEAFARDDLSVIVAKVAAVGPNHYGMDLQLPENAFRFKRWIAGRKSARRHQSVAPRRRRRLRPRRHERRAGSTRRRAESRHAESGRSDAAARPSTPVIGLPPIFAPSPGMTIDVISKYDDKGRRGTGTRSGWASTPARTSTRRSTGSPARISRTTRATRFRCRASSGRRA